ncbi:uncharacterized protein BHQ10_007719 [Talaromyces amestolkiae]|uniref:Zn(2)-C6 fungal-type domain-containing protein n=1 Tax=Talaromyces amestolkiae TaxID=1196081 RepID=A0A364L7C3_TALAM|nr:uncharacterized protein BHQ10_007719 [Talaromyces amestolkiae]RAO71707.1 hypothetical protein BHQ10_007719 [Talaromyces amestolkiae]
MEDRHQSFHDDGPSQCKRARGMGMYQRKRALAACLPCRARKTKCDNIKPTCGFCTNHGAQCTYADTTTDHSSFDPASLAILERLNHVVSLLETQSSSFTAVQHGNHISIDDSTVSQSDILVPTSSHGASNLIDLDIDDDLLLDISGFPATGSSCEAIIKWPIFSNDSLPEVKSFVVDAQYHDSVNPVASRTRAATLGRGIQEEDFILLSRRFLSYVHIKNPILDVPEFTWHVKNAAETGIRWDGPSCLVACVQLQNLLWIQENHQSSCLGQTLDENRRLGQRLYWSCMKTESELRCEISLPPSGLSRFGAHYALPSPPPELVSPLPHPAVEEDSTDSTRIVYQEEERSWFYYLAEISFRRMMNRAFASLGAEGEGSWINKFEQILVRHHALEEQIDLWSSHIPPQIDTNEGDNLDNELAHIVRNRAVACREYIHRPFLYYVIHQPLDDFFIAQAMPLAKKCLDLCVQWQSMAQPLHRHHGTWYVARTSMTRALLLLAAARSKKIEMPQNWSEAVDLALQTLQYWAKEAPDLEKAASYLRILMDNLGEQ